MIYLAANRWACYSNKIHRARHLVRPDCNNEVRDCLFGAEDMRPDWQDLRQSESMFNSWKEVIIFILYTFVADNVTYKTGTGM